MHLSANVSAIGGIPTVRLRLPLELVEVVAAAAAADFESSFISSSLSKSLTGLAWRRLEQPPQDQAAAVTCIMVRYVRFHDAANYPLAQERP